MASLALTSFLESTLLFVKSSYTIDDPPPRITTALDFLKDKVKLSLQILKYLPKEYYNDERVKLVEEKLRITACEGEYDVEKCNQDYNDDRLLKMLHSEADGIDLLSTDLFKCLMPDIFVHEEELSYVVSSSGFNSYEVHHQLFYDYSRNISARIRKEDNELIDLLIAKSKLSSDLEFVCLQYLPILHIEIDNVSVARRIYTDSRTENWFPIRAWVTVFPGDQVEDLLKYILQAVLETNQLCSETYQPRLDEMSSKELCKCLHKQLEDQRYFIVIHDWWISRAWNEISYSFPDKKNGSRILFTNSIFIEMEFGDTLNTNLVLQQLKFSQIRNKFHHLLFGERSCPEELKIMVENIINTCECSLRAVFMVANYLSRIKQTADNWLIVQESITNNALMFEDLNCGIISALLKASEDINSIHGKETGVYFQKCDTNNKQAERFKHLKASSEVAEAKDNEKVGLEECLDRLLPELLRWSPQLEKVAIVGMAGIGKTTLAKRIFDDPSVTSHFHIRAWIDISQFYQKRSLMIQLLQSITRLTDSEILNETDDILEERVYKCLKGQRYLIIMDDLWSIKACSELKRTFPDDQISSRILLTSREANIIEGLNCKIVHQMSLMSEKKSWELLKKKVFGQDMCPQDLVVIGKQIAQKCKGLPLAIVVVAGVLSNIIKTADSWEVVAESVSSHVMGSESATQAIFALSYEHLHDYLKSCFLYMAAFPGGDEIEVRMLIRSWIAEGFIVRAYSKSLEDVAEEYLNDLIDRSLLLCGRRRSNGRLKTCHLHDLVLEFCVQEARKEKFLVVIKDFTQLDSKTMIDGHHRFSFHCPIFEDVHLTASKSLAGSALFFGVSSHPDIFIYRFDFKLLRILDISFWRFDHFPTEQIAKLLLLRYLALTASFELPDTLFKLQKLETLIINGPWLNNSKIPELPPEFWTSTSLRHLQLRVVNHLLSPEKYSNVEYLLRLQTLSNITLASCTYASFAHIPYILKLGVCETHEDFLVVGLWDSFFQNLVLLKCIQTLKISCFGHNRPLPLPSSDAFPNSLKKLTLRQSNLPWDVMTLIGDLPNLEVLKLRNYAFRGPDWVTGGGGFLRLKYLLIDKTNLVCWELESHPFPRLEHLVLKFCRVLKEIPAAIADISTLTHIKLENCCDSVESSAKYIQEECNEYGQDINVQIRSQNLDAFPKTLKKLTLRRSNLPWEVMALIGDLPNLEVLKLRNYAFWGTNWVIGEGGFRCLKYLLIEKTNLICWELEGHHFPRLEQVVLKFCQVLEKIPAEIGNIPTLTHIKLKNCCSAVESSAKDIQEESNEYGQDIKIQIRSQKHDMVKCLS